MAMLKKIFPIKRLFMANEGHITSSSLDDVLAG